MNDYKRICGNCTKCCEGWLEGTIYGKKMYPGKPCHFKKDNGCSIYENRPDEPCKNFNCEWLTEKEIPEWMKPEYSNVILSGKQKNGISFVLATEAGGDMRVEVLNWLLNFMIDKKVNLMYQVKGGWNWIGSPEFVNYMNNERNKNV